MNCGCAEEKLDLLFKFCKENEELLLHEVDFEAVVIRESKVVVDKGKSFCLWNWWPFRDCIFVEVLTNSVVWV